MARRSHDRTPGIPLDQVHPSRTDEAIEVERSVLGALLWQTAHLNELDALDPSDFALPRHAVLLSALRALRDDGAAAETSSLIARLAASGDLEVAGGRAYVEELGTRGGSPDLPYFARKMREWAAERRAVAAARHFISEAHKPCSRSPNERLGDLLDVVEREHRESSTATGLVVLSGEEVEIKETEWLWEPYLPRGAVTFLSGLPEKGKSWLALWLAACLTRGSGLLGPDGRPMKERPAERVVYVSGEDDVERTLAPRFRWLGGDLARVAFVPGLRGPGGTMLPATFEETGSLERLLVRLGAKLLVVDPYSAFFGAGDMNAAPDTRLRLARLRSLAERTGATVLIVRHFRKGAADHALARGQGSIDATAAARSELHAGAYGEGFALTHAKASLSPRGVSFGYRVVTAPDAGPRAARLEWLGVVDATPGSIDPPDRETSGRQSARDDAATFLHERLSDGPVLAETVRDDAERAGISEATLRRAADSLDVQRTKEKGRPHGPWWWSLPAAQDPRDGRALSVLPELVAEEGPVKAVS